eukprot:NODE_86_length_3321_cov_122.116468_g80_i0.p1 GENE.NODE_86_length_3321_cov_122.116468_g80_i0~~NODE_86_length_3321_cov_122.116468_g80_i0.p1  ORF type:complete len:1072 (-),score=349.09 NODE_86_length_3321_cov_122.116468_g80_i0:63-3278(-)
MDAILNFSVPLDVSFLDRVINVMSSGSADEIKQAQAILTQFQEHPEAWQRVDKILETSQSVHTKYFALQILEIVINSRWKILPQEQRLGIREFVVGFIINLSKEESTLRSQKVLVHKLNHTLVQILKQEWPHQWPNFIADLVGASKTGDSLCENNMHILRLLSEEIFDFSAGQMTQNKIKTLKESLNQEFALIFEMCQFVLKNSQNTQLISETLQTLLMFLNWIPLGYIFETKMIETLGARFLTVPAFRNHTLRCLTEIGSLEAPKQYDDTLVAMFSGVMTQLQAMFPLPPEDENHLHYALHVPKLYAEGSEEDEHFIANLGLFFCSFFRSHLQLVETNPMTASHVITAHKYLIGISNVDHKEVFKTCLEYWLFLAEDVFKSWRGTLTAAWGPPPPNSQRKVAYSQVLSDCRRTMIKRMVKPEEVIIVEDENGEITKEFMPDVDAQQLYHSMRELLVFLTHLDYDDTETIMLDKLCSQVDRSEWSWHNLNTLCWAIGSISGAMQEEDEKRFLVAVIKDLLGLCEMMRGKENKAVIASNIMYVVGQYPRFLKAHWKFLKTVVHKLFEFMHETFPGVMEMAVDTFLKIAKQCKEMFVKIQLGEGAPFIEDLLVELPSTINDLDATQRQVFYEAAGQMVAQADTARDGLLMKLMELPNLKWQEIISKAQQAVANMKEPPVMKDLTNVLKTNVRVCRAVGHPFVQQLMKLFPHMMELYKLYSNLITTEVTSKGTLITKHAHVKGMRAVKREILRLVQEFIERNEDPELVTGTFIPPLLDAILMDYKCSAPDARDAQVLSLMAVVVRKLQGRMVADVGKILDATLEVTLQMITKNFEDYPEHRINFFRLLKELNAHCFPSFLAAVQQSKVIMDSIVWAFKHTERNIAETGLTILQDFLRNVLQSEVATPFYQVYFLSLLNDLFVVLTDTLHKTGFKLQCAIIQHMIQVVTRGCITAPLSPQISSAEGNVAYVQQYLLNLFTTFPNLTRRQIEVFIKGMFDLQSELHTFKTHIRDFLIQLKEFAAQDNTDLYDEEREAELQRKKEEMAKRLETVPGLQQPSPPNPREDPEKEGDMVD